MLWSNPKRIQKNAFLNPKFGRNSALNLNYTPQAIADLENIHKHIAVEDDNPIIADQVIARILQAMVILEKFPLAGRTGRIAETREWSISGLPYVGIYAIADETEIDVIAIIHTAQKFPPKTLKRGAR